MSDAFAPRSMKRRNVKGLALTPAAPKPPPTAESAGNDRGNDRGEDRDQLEIGIEFNLDLRPQDIEVIRDLGAGNGGTVSKVRHIPTNMVMARKIIHVEAKREMRKRIVRELQIMHSCRCDYIVTFYGAFLNDNNDVTMCMEYMDVGSLDRVSQDFGPIRVDVLGKIAEATLGGLTYLYETHHIMHRDIKPSNIVVNSRGSIKLCDFGVSGELVNSIADTFVGTSTYMAPERIQGEKYTVKSDVWSFGLTIMELAIGKFPFASADDLEDGEPAGILDLLQQIVHEPAPRLPKSDAFPSILEDMIQKCLFKNPAERPTPKDLYVRDPFVQAAKRTPVDLKEWACSLMERDNRKSHLAPQLSPATQELLRSTDSPTYFSQTGDNGGHNNNNNAMQTPTSGEIPILGAMASPIVRDRDQYSTGSVVVPKPQHLQQQSQHQQQPPPRGEWDSGVSAITSATVGLSLGRPGGSPVHSGMGLRGGPMMMGGSVGTMSSKQSGGGERVQQTVVDMGGPRRATPTMFSLPARPSPHHNNNGGGPGGRLPPPPPPPRKESPDELWRERERRHHQQQHSQSGYSRGGQQPPSANGGGGGYNGSSGGGYSSSGYPHQ